MPHSINNIGLMTGKTFLSVTNSLQTLK